MSYRNMCNYSYLAYLIALLLVKLLSQRTHAMKPSCDATDAVEGFSSTVTCHFQEDVYIQRKTIRIYRYDLEKTKSQPELVLYCHWNNSPQSPTCEKASPSITYVFNEREASITFATTSQNHAGHYKCQANGDKKSKTCNLHVRKPETSCTDVTVKKGETGAITCYFNSDLSKTHDDFYVKWFPDGSTSETALSCNWMGPGNDDWNCWTKHPFTFDNKNIRETITLGVKAESTNLHGEMMCSIVLNTDATVKAKRCSVVVDQIQTTKSVAQHAAEESSNASVSYPISTISKDEASYAVSVLLNCRMSTVALCISLLLLLL